MRKVRVNFSALEFAIEDVSGAHDYYLDLEIGNVVKTPTEIRRTWLQFSEKVQEKTEVTTDDFAKLLMNYTRVDHITPVALKAVHDMETRLGERYLRVPHADTRRSYEDIEQFIVTVENEAFRESLKSVLGGQGAFRRFKEVLSTNRKERERWFRFKTGRMRERISEWLNGHKIEPIVQLEPLAEQVTPNDKPSVRAILIREMLDIVFALTKTTGVVRVGLIGSILTDAEPPRDADILVSVTDESSLAPIAKLGRRWRSVVQSYHCSGDVFLTDAAGNFLGRMCPWKDCGPGQHQQCDAAHCGRRLFLHDDFGTIRLSKQVARFPPLELWPEFTVRAAIPKDIEIGLIQPFLKDKTAS